MIGAVLERRENLLGCPDQDEARAQLSARSKDSDKIDPRTRAVPGTVRPIPSRSTWPGIHWSQTQLPNEPATDVIDSQLDLTRLRKCEIEANAAG